MIFRTNEINVTFYIKFFFKSWQFSSHSWVSLLRIKKNKKKFFIIFLRAAAGS